MGDTSQTSSRRRLPYLWQVGLLFAVYLITARAGLQLGAVSGFATLVWAPTGVALASLLLLGYRLWPGILLGAWLVNMITGAPWLTALAIGVGNTLEAVFGTFVLRRFHFRPALESVRDASLFLVWGALGASLIAATIGVSSLAAAGLVAPEAYRTTWLAWWIGDALGAIIVGNIVLNGGKLLWLRRQSQRIMEAIILLALLLTFNLTVFIGLVDVAPHLQTASSLAYLIFPVLIWAAVRFGTGGAAVAIAITSAISVWGTALGRGPFVVGALSHNLLLLQIFMGTTAATIMVLAAAVAERARANQEVLRLNRAQLEFISLASHELRTPLASIKLYLEALLTGNPGGFSPKELDYLQEIQRSARRMLESVQTLLGVSRIEMGIFIAKPTRTNVRELVNEVIQGVRPQLEEKQIRLHTVYAPEFLWLYVDPGLMSIVLQNLLSNSLRYSPPQTTIRVTGEKIGAEVRLTIRDQGYGIPPAQQPKIFTKLFRASNAQAIEPEGTGLGLYIVKSIVEATGGRIWFDSDTKTGTTFWVAWPETGMIERPSDHALTLG